jgi:hypothetical protein
VSVKTADRDRRELGEVIQQVFGRQDAAQLAGPSGRENRNLCLDVLEPAVQSGLPWISNLGEHRV